MTFENFEIALVLLGQFQNFKKRNRATYPKSPKHVITSTNSDIYINNYNTLGCDMEWVLMVNDFTANQKRFFLNLIVKHDTDNSGCYLWVWTPLECRRRNNRQKQS